MTRKISEESWKIVVFEIPLKTKTNFSYLIVYEIMGNMGIWVGCPPHKHTFSKFNGGYPNTHIIVYIYIIYNNNNNLGGRFSKKKFG